MRLFGWVASVSLCIALFQGCATAIQVKAPQTNLTTHGSNSTPEPASLKTSPRLVVEAGGHRALIRELLFTADGRELISVSDDKTIRVWTTPRDGRRAALARTIRGQIGGGRGGAIYAAALAPADGGGQHPWLAVGGFLAGADEDRYAIRIHDYASGDVVALLRGHRDVVNALAFSPTGQWLASASKDHTVRLWDLASLSVARTTKAPLTLTTHTDAIYDLAWASDGHRLATASHDRTVGLWDTTRLGQGVATLIKRLRGHRRPVHTVAFHPDGTELVSGGMDRTIRRWRVRDGKTLGVFTRTGNWVAALAFAPDGQTVLTGRMGMGRGDDATRIRLYDYPTGAERQGFAEHSNVVLATAFHPSGRWAASAGGNQKEILLWDTTTGEVLSRLQGSGRTVWAVGFDPDGESLSWGQTYQYADHHNRGPLEHRFHLTRLERIEGGLSSAASVRAMDRVGERSLDIERGGPYDYPYRLHVRRGGKRLSTIERHAANGYRHTAYTFTPDGQSVLSGGFHGVLTLYNAMDGKVRAQFSGHTGDIKAVSVSADGRWAASGASDQTLNLWSLSNVPTAGEVVIKPTLTLFPTADGDWIAWTPEGFFAASDHGSRLVGYTLNQGPDKRARYVSIDQMYESFYRPDRVQAKVQGVFEKESKQETSPPSPEAILAGGLPPLVRILSPVRGATVNESTINVQVLLCDQGGGIGKVEWKRNGKFLIAEGARRVWPLEQADVPVNATCPNARDAVSTLSNIRQTGPIPLLPGENTVEVTAYNQPNQIASPSVRLTVQYAAPTRQVPSSPALHILAIGINAYRHNTALTLNYAVSDIEALSRDLRQVGSPTFRDVRYTGRTNAQATRQGVEAAFAEAAAHVQPDDVFVLMLSGHGVVEAGQYYFLPADIPYLPPDRPNVTTEVIRAHGLNTRDFQHWFSGLKTRKTVIFLDTCHSGAFSFSPAPRDAENFEQSAMRYTTSIDRLGRATGQVIVAATTAQEKALEGYNNHGFFTYVLLEALRYADTPLCGNNDGELALAEIFNFVRWRLPILSRQASGTEFEQIPRVIIQQAEWRYFQSPIGRALRPDTVPSPLPSRLNQACAKERLAAR